MVQNNNSKFFGQSLRAEFPIFEHSQQLRSKPLVFLDSAASSQKPRKVIDRLSDYLSYEHANVHRGAYELSAKATDNYDFARKVAAKFVGSKKTENIIFTKGATESVNLAALAIQDILGPGDKVLLTLLEHHSNIVPWQLLAKRRRFSIDFAEISDCGEIELEDFRARVRSLKPKVVAFTMLSNALGSVTPYNEMIEIAKQSGALILLDAAQSAVHQDINVSELGCDFLVFSGHKLYGPTGSGVLYASDRALEVMEPVYGGGDMISSVTVVGSDWAEPPHKFEAGTPAIAEIIAMASALEFLSDLKSKGLAQFESAVFEAFWQALSSENDVQLYGPRTKSSDAEQTSIISFNIKGVHPHDFATVADEFSVQIRAGHHCAQPLLSRLGLQSAARVSFAAYSDIDQIEPLLEAIRYARKVFG